MVREVHEPRPTGVGWANPVCCCRVQVPKLQRCYSWNTVRGRSKGWRGWADVFHEDCDDKGPTVLVVKTRFGRRFGGVADVPWALPPHDLGNNAGIPSLVDDKKYGPKSMYSEAVNAHARRRKTEHAFLFCLNCSGAALAGQPPMHQLKLTNYEWVTVQRRAQVSQAP